VGRLHNAHIYNIFNRTLSHTSWKFSLVQSKRTSSLHTIQLAITSLILYFSYSYTFSIKWIKGAQNSSTGKISRYWFQRRFRCFSALDRVLPVMHVREEEPKAPQKSARGALTCFLQALHWTASALLCSCCLYFITVHGLRSYLASPRNAKALDSVS
jgi:hypothetical protein